jgi:hypothetical protein
MIPMGDRGRAICIGEKMAYVITDTDRRLFKRCQRAWDLGAVARQNYTPAKPESSFDFAVAIREAMAAYYFPGMWDWSRVIVRPLAQEAFVRAIQQQHAAHTMHCEQPAREENDRQRLLKFGEAMLGRYFEWAVKADRFTPLRVQAEFEANAPDARCIGQDLVTLQGEPVRYQGCISLLVEENGQYLLVEHLIRHNRWAQRDELLLDEQGLSHCWAWQSYFLGMKLAALIYNEMLTGDAALCCPDGIAFRRTKVPKSAEEIENFGEQIGLEALDMIDPELRLYPNPCWVNCSGCIYRAPCLAMNERRDPEAVLASGYVKRTGQTLREGKLGRASWSTGRGAAPPGATPGKR